MLITWRSVVFSFLAFALIFLSQLAGAQPLQSEPSPTNYLSIALFIAVFILLFIVWRIKCNKKQNRDNSNDSKNNSELSTSKTEHQELAPEILEKLAQMEKLAQQQNPEQSASNEIEVNQTFTNQVELIVAKRHGNTDFSVAALSHELGISERQLHRKFKSHFPQTANDYIRVYRLKRAAELLIRGKAVNVVAKQVGFSSKTYFAQCFKKYFAQSPSQYQASGPKLGDKSKIN